MLFLEDMLTNYGSSIVLCSIHCFKSRSLECWWVLVSLLTGIWSEGLSCIQAEPGFPQFLLVPSGPRTLLHKGQPETWCVHQVKEGRFMYVGYLCTCHHSPKSTDSSWELTADSWTKLETRLDFPFLVAGNSFTYLKANYRIIWKVFAKYCAWATF